MMIVEEVRYERLIGRCVVPEDLVIININSCDTLPVSVDLHTYLD